MCLICVEFQLGNLTIREAKNNFVEIAETLDDVHRIRVMDMIEKAELQQIVDEEEENKED
tara:strand:- start:963 stop:1142 length:180 start_codon:yes stop_codon:yes gene_type:complete